MLRYAWRDLLHNPRRTLATLVGVTLGVGLFSGVLFFMDGSGATMTDRAIAPVALDIQRVITAPPGGGLRLTERLSDPAALGAGRGTTVILTVTNVGDAPANDVVVNDVPPPPLAYVNGSTTIDGEPVPDVAGDSPLSHGLAGFGLNVGRVAPGAGVTIAYVADADRPVADAGSLPLSGTVSSREQLEPIPANAPPVLTLEQLRAQVSAIPGVASADLLGFVDLAPGALTAGGVEIGRPVRVYAFDRRYQAHYASIRLVEGGFRPGSTLLSVEAARVLGTGPGGSVQLRIPGRPTPLALPVSGVVDLTRAQPLFASRKATKLEEFLYVPDVVVVTPETFRDEIVPAFDRARASVGSVMKRFPVQELDVTIERERLRADPAAALSQTTRIADAIDRIAPGQGYLIDNISNTLTVAVGDAAVGRRMFLFLGLPGVLMAAFLAAYAGGLLAAAQRREQANLRVRGAHRGHLRRIAVYKALAFAAAGSLVGIAFGLASAMTILGPAAFGGVPLGHLAVSGLIAAGVGAMITAVALYLPARRSVDREVSEERREMAVPRPPMWWRLRLDLAMLAVAAVVEVAAVRSVALSPPQGSVYFGVAISLPSWPLLVPLVVWVAGLLVCVRLLLAVVSRVPREPSRRFGPVLRGLLARSIRRRPWSAATGVLGLGLIVGFGVSLAIFIASYDTAKAADATFTVGADLRITPSALASRPLGPGDGSAFVVPGISAVSPVVFGIENSVLVGPHDQGAANLAAIDPATFADVAPTPVAPAADGAPTDVLAALAADPSGVLVDAETADDLGIEPGDSVEVILALGTKRETRKRFRVAGVFERFPAFPEGANLVVNLETFASATGRADVDFFLADATLDGRVGLDRAIEALRSGPGAADPIRIDSTETALAKDQSSLTAVNVNGLVGMASFYVVVMSAASVAMFVFGLMLQRRREYVTLLAQGMRMRELHGLVFGEAALVALGGVAGGLLVGVGTAFLFVDVLRALFVLEPNVTMPIGRIALLVGSVVLATFGSGLAATETLRRLRPTEILREE